ncbi:hypothetical protein H5P28_07090 [Ruficoccus amylovorans]|uniref:Uncharacterized protein n=1 Tax=Ruficoccus amylovorans TaxID=1804625 RepID=A0A842HES1_9BACT|nr:hypothetical protein [Ruficoccus amylovorans]MBC2594024.1 hypothetical protein [Ruficoccus amylovorans]
MDEAAIIKYRLENTLRRLAREIEAWTELSQRPENKDVKLWCEGHADAYRDMLADFQRTYGEFKGKVSA